MRTAAGDPITWRSHDWITEGGSLPPGVNRTPHPPPCQDIPVQSEQAVVAQRHVRVRLVAGGGSQSPSQQITQNDLKVKKQNTALLKTVCKVPLWRHRSGKLFQSGTGTLH